MTASLAQCRFLLSQAEPFLADLDDSHRALEPQRGMKTAGWLVGHLAVSGDFARVLCGRRGLCPRDWGPIFKPGSEPSRDSSTYPSMSALREALRSVYADLPAAAREADPELLSVPNPFTPARTGFPTAGDFVAYLASGHLGYHLGQLVAWRSAAGLRHPPRSGSLVGPMRP